MIPKRAIELSIQGGWRDFHRVVFVNDANVRIELKPMITVDEDANGNPVREHQAISMNPYTVALDPTFWESLCGALGLKNALQMSGRYGFRLPVWKHEALSFFDLILTGGDVQAFWDDLLGK